MLVSQKCIALEGAGAKKPAAKKDAPKEVAPKEVAPKEVAPTDAAAPKKAKAEVACPQCGVGNKATYKFCRKCGLAAGSPAPAKGEPTEAEKKAAMRAAISARASQRKAPDAKVECPACKTSNKPSYKFCR